MPGFPPGPGPGEVLGGNKIFHRSVLHLHTIPFLLSHRHNGSAGPSGRSPGTETNPRHMTDLWGSSPARAHRSPEGPGSSKAGLDIWVHIWVYIWGGLAETLLGPGAD